MTQANPPDSTKFKDINRAEKLEFMAWNILITMGNILNLLTAFELVDISLSSVSIFVIVAVPIVAMAWINICASKLPCPSCKQSYRNPFYKDLKSMLSAKEWIAGYTPDECGHCGLSQKEAYPNKMLSSLSRRYLQLSLCVVYAQLFYYYFIN